MDPQEHHEMVLAVTHPSGAEEWFCPSCGRRFLLKWPPAYQKIVLEPGDEYAAHSGSKGNLMMQVSQTADTDDAELTEGLRPWLKWMRDSGLDNPLDLVD